MLPPQWLFLWKIQSLIDEFADLFQAPDSIPPSHQCNHAIPLIPGSQPFYIRLYRYPLALKDEIERQVQEMLSQGLIQPSTSMFSSPVLLVKKKDLSYRFYVDFRKLNAMTVKSKYPVPVIDQLLDELKHASWFTKLDLRAGFH
jgi:tRNA A37 N6-isopentenylltransferase MiaA